MNIDPSGLPVKRNKMGRPNQCNACCGGVDPPDPPIGDCERVICITFMDENSGGIGRGRFDTKYEYFKEAYPDRLLFVLDVENGKNDYPQNFIDSDTAFSLREEHTKDPNITNGLRYIERENPTGGGDTATANFNDAWGRIKSIVNHYGGDVLAKFNAATEFSVFRDDSGSMRANQVEATYDKLVADALVDGKLEARAIVNKNEDTICPFVQGQCCTNSSSTALMTLCGITPDCDPEALNFTQQPESALIREYCDNVQFFPPGEGFDTVCGTCLDENQEDDKQSTEFTAVATNGAGQGLNVPLSFSLQASDDLLNWNTIENLPDGTSGQEQSLSALLDDWDGNSVNTTECHNWLQNSCDQYQETIIGSCRKRVWSRRFRIEAQTDNGLVAYSDPFQIYQWYGPNEVDPPSPDGGRWLGGNEIPAGYVGSFTSNTNYSKIGFQDFCDAKNINYLPQNNSRPPLLTGPLWNYRTSQVPGGALNQSNGGFSKGLVWIFDGGDGGVNDSWEQLTGFAGFAGDANDGYATESSIWNSEFQRGTIVDVAGNRSPSTNEIVAVQAGAALPRVELFDKYGGSVIDPKLDTVDHISQIEDVRDGVAGSDSFSVVASPFVLKTDPSLNNVLSEKLHIFAHVIKGTNKLQFYAQSPNTKKFIRVSLETGFDDWPLLFDNTNNDVLGNISIHARPIVIQNGDGTYGGHTSVHVAYSIKQNGVTKMFVQRWRMEYFATDSLGFGPIDEGFVIFREEDPEIPDSTEIAGVINGFDSREFITTSYSDDPVVVKFSKQWSKPAILTAFGRGVAEHLGANNINVYRWDNQSGLGIQNYRLGDWTKRQEITGRSIVEQFEPNLDTTYKWQFPVGANKLAMTDLSMEGHVIAFPYYDFNIYPSVLGGSPQGSPAVVMEWNGSEYIKKGNILYDWTTLIGTYPDEGYWRTSNYGGLSLNGGGQAIILATRLDFVSDLGDIDQSPVYNALSTYRWLPE